MLSLRICVESLFRCNEFQNTCKENCVELARRKSRGAGWGAKYLCLHRAQRSDLGEVKVFAVSFL